MLGLREQILFQKKIPLIKWDKFKIKRIMMNESIGRILIENSLFRFRALKDLGEKAIGELDDGELTLSPDAESNSVAVICQHLHGNMLSRWTQFLTTDGEKETRDRDAEFTPPVSLSRSELMERWDEGWAAVFTALETLEPVDLLKIITIRGQGLTVMDAILRQISHYGYHVGQIVYLAKQLRGSQWKTLSIPRGKSREYRPQKRD